VDSVIHQIGEVAEAVGLTLRTIRYYEEVGVVPPSGRTAGGFRLYTDDDIERLRLVKQMKPLDFSLEEMRDLFAVRDRLAQDVAGEDREQLTERLGMYAAIAHTRCEALRAQLESAEGMATTLHRETARARRRSRSKR
jgi:DNA-binding transcriptional MerR regulator